MKKILFSLVILLPLSGFSQSELLNRFKQKVKDRVEQRADEGMDKVLDKAEEGVKNEGTASKQKETEKKSEKVPATEMKPTAVPASFESYSRYDFIPGDNIVYAEDFSQDVIGEFPLKWSTNSRGETVTIGAMENKWLRLFQNSLFLSPYIKSLPENFTAEFDLVLNFKDKELSYIFPQVDVYLLNSAAGDEKGKNFFNSQSGRSTMKIAIAPSAEENSSISVTSDKNGTETFNNSPKPLTKLGYNYGKPVHFAIWIQKERFRMWMNGEKIYDIPQAVPENPSFNRFGFGVASSNYAEENVGYYITNIKFAQGAPDMRSKLITEGKLVTTGILFDVNSDKIKPESFGVLQEIGKVLKENAAVKVKIIGHTDSDGNDAKNLDLSKRRAASVKLALSTQLGIDASRMETDGKGEAQPVSDNNTNEGKAKNRRVEFIKQ
jgi:OOP family OmpA-OmpF porin